MNADDRRLITECLTGQPDAFGQLVLRYQDRLYNSVYRVLDNPDDTLDVVQDAFINAYQSLDRFNGTSEFFTWLYRIAFNTAISLKRKKRPVLSLDAGKPGESGVDPADPSESLQPGAELERADENRKLMAALAKLSVDHRTVLVLKDLEDQKYEEIAEIMNVPIGTVRSRLHRARAELRELLEDEDG